MGITPDAAQSLLGHLGPNRALVLGELEKISVYKGEAGTVDVEDVLALVGDAGSSSLGAVAYAAGEGDRAGLERTLDAALSEGLAPVSILRSVAQHLQRLIQAKSLVAGGMTPRQAAAALKPPVMFRLEAAFRRQMERWPPPRLAAALALVTHAELRCKETGTPSALLCSRTVLQIGEMSRRGG
jgi:DNA polymerase-3 subunit delta